MNDAATPTPEQQQPSAEPENPTDPKWEFIEDERGYRLAHHGHWILGHSVDPDINFTPSDEYLPHILAALNSFGPLLAALKKTSGSLHDTIEFKTRYGQNMEADELLVKDNLELIAAAEKTPSLTTTKQEQSA